MMMTGTRDIFLSTMESPTSNFRKGNFFHGLLFGLKLDLGFREWLYAQQTGPKITRSTDHPLH
jgi:hypothetical protein